MHTLLILAPILLVVASSIAFVVYRRSQRAPLPSWQDTLAAEEAARLERERDQPEALQHLALLQAAHAALFGSEYIAASDLIAWRATHADALGLATSSRWTRWLSGDDAEAARTLCATLLNLSQAVAAHNAAFVERRIAEEQAAFDQVERFPLTKRQREAIVTNQDTTLVIAGAGTGKTSTIVGKVDYLLRRGLAQPDDILLLAYNGKAADELKDRILKLGHPASLQISTFHAFGLDVIKQAEKRNIILSPLAKKNELRHDFLQACLIDLWQDAATRPILFAFFATMYDQDEPQAVVQAVATPEQYVTLTGKRVRSKQEVEIANWLTLHGIRYEYERLYPFQTGSKERGPYRPDFYLPEHDVYIEHFGIDRQGRTRRDIDREQYLADMAWKRATHREHGTTLIETFSYHAQEGGLAQHLKELLEAKGIVGQAISSAKIKEVLTASATPASKLVKLLDQFLTLFKGSGLDLASVKQKATTPRDHAFLHIFEAVYDRYQEELTRTELIDFNDMIGRARQAAETNAYTSHFRFIIIDEFQDISQNRLGLILALRNQVPQARLFVVGDDWQSIYRFAGSEVALITNLQKYAGATARVDLDTTFRYPQELLDASARFVEQNPAQLKKHLRAHGGAAGSPPLVLIFQENTGPAGVERAIDVAFQDIEAQNADTKSRVFLLGRYRRNEPANLDETQRVQKTKGRTVEYHTMHSAKGKEADQVILVGLDGGTMSFPSTIPDDAVLRLVLPEPEAYPHAEERRLCYVALTRSRQRVYLIVPPAQRSPFVDELLGPDYAPYRITLGTSPATYPCPACTQSTILKQSVGNQAVWRCAASPRCRGELKWCPGCHSGAIWWTPGAATAHCTNCAATPTVCPQCKAGVLQERNGKYGVFLGCSAWQGGQGCGYTQSMAGPTTTG